MPPPSSRAVVPRRALRALASRPRRPSSRTRRARRGCGRRSRRRRAACSLRRPGRNSLSCTTPCFTPAVVGEPRELERARRASGATASRSRRACRRRSPPRTLAGASVRQLRVEVDRRSPGRRAPRRDRWSSARCRAPPRARAASPRCARRGSDRARCASPSGSGTPPCSRIARIERTRCWLRPHAPGDAVHDDADDALSHFSPHGKRLPRRRVATSRAESKGGRPDQQRPPHTYGELRLAPARSVTACVACLAGAPVAPSDTPSVTFTAPLALPSARRVAADGLSVTVVLAAAGALDRRGGQRGALEAAAPWPPCSTTVTFAEPVIAAVHVTRTVEPALGERRDRRLGRLAHRERRRGRRRRRDRRRHGRRGGRRRRDGRLRRDRLPDRERHRLGRLDVARLVGRAELDGVRRPSPTPAPATANGLAPRRVGRLRPRAAV